MVKRNEGMVAVRDPKGKLFEVSRRNATDLVQHSGWTYDRPAGPTTDELATAKRNRIPRGEKVAQSRELAAKQKAEAEAVAPVKVKGKPGRKPKTVALPTYDVDDESDDVTPFDAGQVDDLEDELDALEAEEEARIPKELE
jgi:hypothetical protein